MTTIRDDRLARLRGAVDRELAEAIRVEPQIAGDFGSMADPARPAFEAAAVPRTGAGGDRNLSGGRAMDWTARVATQVFAVAIDATAWPRAATVRTGDRVVLTERGTAFEVARVDPHGRSRLVWSLTQR
jgi:hypothetical protein